MTSKMTWAEAALVLGAIGRVLRDSNRIDDIHLVADITGRTRFQRLLARVRSTAQGQRLLRLRPMLGPDDIDLDVLRGLGSDTLGGAFARHLQAHRLELYEGPPSSKYLPDPDVRYLVHRYRQLHDIWHVLLGLGTAGHEEVLVHAFTLGHLGLPNSALIVGFGSVKHLVLEGRLTTLRHGLREAYAAGRAARDMLTRDWSALWTEQLPAVRREVGVTALRHV